MAPEHRRVSQVLIDKLSRSRDFTISCILHLILVAVFGTTILFQSVKEPPADFQSGDGDRFVDVVPIPAPRPKTPPPSPRTPENFPLAQDASRSDTINTIKTTAPLASDFAWLPIIAPLPTPTNRIDPPKPAPSKVESLSATEAAAIGKFTDWKSGKNGARPGASGTREDEFEFTAYIGQYSGGNWNSTIQMSGNKIENGSLPNLLYFMSSRSKNKVKTNYKNVRAIPLGSDELFSVRPPFLFLTGTRDFTLSDKEVENLQNYVRLGGAIWGDSSVPGHNSRFDIAFRREMKRVISDVNKDWEVIPANHPIYTQGYFPEVKEIPPGLNYYKEPIYTLKFRGEIAILYTANDYGDMWQVGLNEQGQVDTRKNENGTFVALNPNIWGNRENYLRNTSPESLAQTYKFGTNLVIHLLTRWERKTRSASSL
jgi:hypothetical protein